jgi:hypothetical protein
MTTISASEELYELSSREALSWLEKAQGQRYCAKILKDHLLQMVGDKTPAWTRRVETLEVVSSALLLVGLACMSRGIRGSSIGSALIVLYGNQMAGTVLLTLQRT